MLGFCFLSFADFQLNLFWGLAISGRLECILWGPVFYSGVEFRALGRWLRVGLRTLDGVQCFLIVLSRLQKGACSTCSSYPGNLGPIRKLSVARKMFPNTELLICDDNQEVATEFFEEAAKVFTSDCRSATQVLSAGLFESLETEQAVLSWVRRPQCSGSLLGKVYIVLVISNYLVVPAILIVPLL